MDYLQSKPDRSPSPKHKGEFTKNDSQPLITLLISTHCLCCVGILFILRDYANQVMAQTPRPKFKQNKK